MIAGMSRATVVYVHGLFMSGRESLLLRHRLRRDFGYEVHTYRYSATTMSLADCLDGLGRLVRELAPRTLHLVGHSLGGLVIYRFLERHPEVPPGRAVFLGTPAVASRAAAAAVRMPWMGRRIGRGVAGELIAPYERRWGFPRELGIIAGTRPLGLGQLLAHFKEACDGTVAVAETRLGGATGHLCLPVSHMGMLLSERVEHEVGHFLEQGRFSSVDQSSNARSR